MIKMILTKVHWGHSGCSVKPYHDHGFIIFHHDELVYGAANNEGYKNDYHEDNDCDGFRLQIQTKNNIVLWLLKRNINPHS